MAERNQDAVGEHRATVRLLLAVKAAAERLSISRTRMYALIKSGEVASVQVGRLRRIPVGALEAVTSRLLSTTQLGGRESQWRETTGLRARGHPTGASSIYLGGDGK